MEGRIARLSTPTHWETEMKIKMSRMLPSPILNLLATNYPNESSHLYQLEATQSEKPTSTDIPFQKPSSQPPARWLKNSDWGFTNNLARYEPK